MLNLSVCISGFFWGFLHTGTASIPDKDTQLTLVSHGNIGELYPDHVMAYQGCRLKSIKSNSNPGDKLKIYRSTFIDKSPLFHISEWRTRSDKNKHVSGDVFQSLRRFIINRVYRIIDATSEKRESTIENWFFGILLGNTLHFSREIKLNFQITGLYHLLSVGGMHLSSLVWIVKIFLRWPFSLVYSVCLVPRPAYWPFVWYLLGMVTILFVALFMNVVGYDPAIQRSTIMFVFYVGSQLYWGRGSSLNGYLLCLCAQSLLFPIGFLSEGNFMSWLSSVKIARNFIDSENKKFADIIGGAIRLQIELAIYSAAFFGNLSLIGILINPLMVPAFTVVFIMCVVSLVTNMGTVNQIAIHNIENYLYLTSQFARITGELPWIYANLSEYPWFIRGFFVVLSGIISLNVLKKSSIDKKGGQTYGISNMER